MDITNHIVLIGKQGSGKTSLAKALGCEVEDLID